jgi:hypothetical protein
MYFLTYVSAAVAPFTNDQLRDLLGICEKNNRRDGISGMLLYKDGNFMQVLEGTEAVVRQTHARITSDPRHGGLITLLQGPQKERQFPDWSMGFRDLGTGSPKPAGYSEFLNSPLTGQEFAANPNRAQKLLMTFKKIM